MSRRKNSNPISLFSFQDIITSVTGIMILVTLLIALELSQRVLNSPRVQTIVVSQQLEGAVADAELEISDLEARLAEGDAELQRLAAVDRRRLAAEQNDIQRQLEQLDVEMTRLAKQAQDAEKRQADIEAREQAQKQNVERADELDRRIEELEEQIRKLKSSNRVIYNPAVGTSKEAWLVELTGGTIQAAPMGRAAKPSVFSVVSAGQIPGAFEQWLGGLNPRSEYLVLLIKASGVELFNALKEVLEQKGFELGFDVVDEGATVIDPQTGAGA